MTKGLHVSVERVVLFLLLFVFGALRSYAQDAIGQALVEVSEGQYSRAISVLEEAIQANPKDIKARFVLGNIYFQMRDYAKAEDQYSAIISIDPNNVSALNNLGFAEQALGRMQSAILTLQRVEKIDPKFVPAHANLAFVYERMGNVDAAIQEYKTIGSLQPSKQASMALALLYRKKNDYSDAAKTLNVYLQAYPGDAEAWEALAEVYLAENKGKEAWQASQEAVKIEPSGPAFLLTHARAAASRGYFSQAIDDAKKVIKMEPNEQSLVHAEASKILAQTNERILERKVIWLIAFFLFLFVNLLVVMYFLRKSGRKEVALTRMVEKWEEDLEALSDLQEIAEFLLAYFVEFFRIPKGMFYLVTREGGELKCAHTNLKVVLTDALEVNSEFAEKWMRIYQGRPMSVTQAYKSTYFFEAFPGMKEACEKHDMRFFIPFCEKGKVLAMLLLGGVTRTEFRGFLPKIRKKAETAYLFAQKASQAMETAMLYKLSVVDEQTKVYNKRFFKQVLLEELKRVERYQQPCSLLMIDIDHFKKLNDTYGHPQGDMVLKELAEVFKENVREGMDSVSRYGGEEFAIILPAAAAEKALETAERIRSSVYGHAFSGLSPNIKVTVSIGIASYPDHAVTDWELIKAADQALYQSKKNGRNRVSMTEKELQEEEAAGTPGRIESPAVRTIPPFHSFQFRLEGEIRRAQADKYLISVVFLQVDNFPSIGKPDRLLLQLASLSQPHLRVIDFYSSNHEGSLLFMLSEKGGKEAASTIEQICRKAKASSFYGVSGPISVSAGVAVFPEDGKNPEELVNRAQAARNEAARQGSMVLTYHDFKQPV